MLDSRLLKVELSNYHTKTRDSFPIQNYPFFEYKSIIGEYLLFYKTISGWHAIYPEDIDEILADYKIDIDNFSKELMKTQEWIKLTHA